MFKMDFNANGILVEKSMLHDSLALANSRVDDLDGTIRTEEELNNLANIKKKKGIVCVLLLATHSFSDLCLLKALILMFALSFFSHLPSEKMRVDFYSVCFFFSHLPSEKMRVDFYSVCLFVLAFS